MKDIQFLSIEIGDKCNLSSKHPLCPSSYRQKKNENLTDNKIIDIVKEAYEKFDFKGYVAWHFYNEPLIYRKRMFSLMKTLKQEVKNVRFVLWTNGELLTKNKDLDLFDHVVVTNYMLRPVSFFELFIDKNKLSVITPAFDGRLEIKGKVDYKTPCLRPYIEFIISYYGDVHLCCQDWKNEIKIGNVFYDKLEILVKRHRRKLATISKGMSRKSPETCITCKGRLPYLVRFFNES